MRDAKRVLGLDQPGTYDIKVPGRLDESWSDWAEEVKVAVEEGDDGPTITTLTVTVADQAALQGLLDRLYSIGLPLLSVTRMDRP